MYIPFNRDERIRVRGKRIEEKLILVFSLLVPRY